jgi:hypothetical protein
MKEVAVNRSVEVRAHWQTVVEDFNMSTLDFYRIVEEAVNRRQLPDVTIARTDLHEGGVFSAKREYLVVKRGKLTFAVCAAPFGKGQFFSWWLLETMPRFTILFAIAFVALVPVIGLAMIASMGIVKGLLWFVVIGGAALWMLVSGSLFDTAALDATILATPYLGSVYQKLLRPATFYAADTTAMFQESVRKAVRESVESVCGAKGVRAFGADGAAPSSGEVRTGAA